MLANFNSFKGANEVFNIGVIATGSRGSGLIPFINKIKNLNVVVCWDILPFHLQELYHFCRPELASAKPGRISVVKHYIVLRLKEFRLKHG
jgi:hypothetical protein